MHLSVRRRYINLVFKKKTKTVIFPTTWFIHQTSFLHSMKRHLVANPTKYHCSIIPFLSSSFRTTYYILHIINSCWRWGLLRLFFFVITHPNSLLWTHAITEAAASMCVKVHGNSSKTTSYPKALICLITKKSLTKLGIIL